VLIKRPEEVKDSTTVKFINYKKPFEEVLTSDNLVEIERASKVKSTDDFRVFPITKKELLKDGIKLLKEKTLLKRPEDLPYIGSKWGGKYLRAPDIFFKILEKGKDKLVRLGEIAEVRFGIKSGANEFFYLDKAKIEKWGIEKEFLKPVMKSPRECKSILIKTEDLKYKIFMCHKSKSKLKDTNALRYIEWGEKQKFYKRPSCRGRQRWYDLGIQDKPDVVWSRVHNDSHRIFILGNEILVADTFSVIYFNTNGNDRSKNKIIINTTLPWLHKEIIGRKSFGEGALGTLGIDIVNIFIPRSEIIKESKNHFLEIGQRFINRSIKSIFQELGFPKPNKDYSNIDPNNVSLDKVMPDRRELDRIIFEALGLTEEEQLEVYRAVVELVKNRLVKARSI